MNPIRKSMTTSSSDPGLSGKPETSQLADRRLMDGQSKPYQPNELLTVGQICDEYGIGRTMMYELLGNGQLPAKVIGKRGTRIRRGDIDDLVKSLPAYRRPSST